MPIEWFGKGGHFPSLFVMKVMGLRHFSLRKHARFRLLAVNWKMALCTYVGNYDEDYRQLRVYRHPNCFAQEMFSCFGAFFSGLLNGKKFLILPAHFWQPLISGLFPSSSSLISLRAHTNYVPSNKHSLKWQQTQARTFSTNYPLCSIRKLNDNGL